MVRRKASKKKTVAVAKSKKTTVKKTGIVEEKKTAEKTSDKHIKPFPIVGIGASAGGMEAFSLLLENLRHDLGMAYVYIQHLSPDHSSFLPQILQRKTKMPVLTVVNNLEVKKDHVYIIPAKYLIKITDGKLKLETKPKGHQANAIDHFLSSLAPLYQQNSIGVILSGTGTDGTLGLMAIKAEGGITFAQDNTAQYMGMPHNAADMGFVDFLLPPDKIAVELGSLSKHPYRVTSSKNILVANKHDLQKILLLMQKKKDVDFSQYKQTTIQRRIMRRMVLNRVTSLGAYVQMLNDNKNEADALYQDLLITVTDFFRDTIAYDTLISKILPDLLKERKLIDPVRIWIPGCATGEEAFSFAIILLEALGEKALTTQIQIFATDINQRSIEKARAGVYVSAAMRHVSPERLRRFFVRSNDHYQVIKSIRDMCVFAPHNLLKDPPFSRMDIISCQNVLIYLEAASQNRIMHTFHYALKPTGYLLLGKSETVGAAADLFTQPFKQVKLYTKKSVTTPLPLDLSKRIFALPENTLKNTGTHITQQDKVPDLEKETDRLLLSKYTPASVLVNKDLEILRFRGSTSRFLEPASGKASLHLLKMVRQELVLDLRSLIQAASKEGRPATKAGITTDGKSGSISIEVNPLNNNGTEKYFLIVFNEVQDSPVTAAKTGGKRINDSQFTILQTQLKDARETIKILTEDFEATREELQSANEEVLSSNEELQSINEELETSKEELQSSNEELTTVNDELQMRNNDLKESEDYATAIIETMHESLIMLSDDLHVKKANKGFYKTFKVVPEKTEGSYLFELGSGQWDIPELRKLMNILLTKDVPFVSFEVTHSFPEIGWKSMLVNGQKFPIRDSSNSMILLAIQDLTDRKLMEKNLAESEERFRLLVQNASDIITIFDPDGTIKYESAAVISMLGYSPEERVGRNINVDPIVHPDDLERLMSLLKTSTTAPAQNLSGEFRIRHKNGSYRTIDAIFRNLLDNQKINGIIANYRDITERKLLESQKDAFIGIASHELKTPVTSIKAYAQILEEQFRNARDEKSAHLLSRLNSQVDRLTTLIIDLLDYTRIDGGSLKVRNEEYDINGLINEVIEDVQRTSPGYTIEKKLGKTVFLNGDRYRVGQVLTNLLSNAIKYSPKAKKVIVTTKINDKNFVVSVQDFGIGIDDTLLESVFDRFFRIKQAPVNTFPGLGLGLYIAAEIIKRQGGKIWAESKKSKGSTFFFSLPLNE